MAGKPVVVVVGAGPQGLASALELLKAGWCSVSVVSRAPVSTPHADATKPHCALWELPPYQVEPVEKATKWALDSLDLFKRLAADSPEAGIRYPVRQYNLSRAELPPNPFAAQLQNYTAGPAVLREPALLASRELGHGMEAAPMPYTDGQAYDSAVIDVTKHLDWLVEKIKDHGGGFVQADVGALRDVVGLHPGSRVAAIVNATGLGSAALAPDSGMYPVRGQLLFIRAPLVGFAAEDVDTGAYCIPGSTWVEVGGTLDRGEWNTDPDPSASVDIMKRANDMLPILQAQPGCVRRTWAGLRPCRTDGVRLEVDETGAGADGGVVPVVHNYGHGGSGIITAHGCGREVATLCRALVQPAQPARAKL